MPQQRIGGTWKERGAWIVLLALAFQLACLAWVMPINAIGSGNWLLQVDNPYHIYQLELGRALLLDGRLTGYDPFFGAGSMGGLSSNVSARLSLLVAWLMPGSTPSATVYAVYVLLCSLLPIAFLALLGSLLNFSQRQLALALSVGLALWWIGVPRWYHSVGMASFVCASYAAPAFAVWAYQVCDRPLREAPFSLLMVGVMGGLGEWLHPLFCIPVLVLFIGTLAHRFELNRLWPLLLRGVAVAFVVVLVCLPWVLALIGSGGLESMSEQPFQRTVGFNVLARSLGLGASPGDGAVINLFIMAALLLCLSIYGWRRRSSAGSFVLAGAGLLLFSSFAALSSALAVLQPNRFVVPAFLCLALALALYAGEEASAWAIRRKLQLQIVVTAFCVIAAGWSMRELARELSRGAHPHHGKPPPELAELDPAVARLQNWLLTNTRDDARILFETSLGRVHSGGHIAGYLAASTHREFVGAAYPYFLPQLSCWDRACFGRPIEQLTEEFFNSMAKAYNIGWVVAHSPELKRRLDTFALAKRQTDIGPSSLYSLDRAHSFVQAGPAQVVARGFNRIEVSGALGPDVVLRYRWVPGLETVPKAELEPLIWAVGMPPMIRVLNPPEHFILRMAR